MSVDNSSEAIIGKIALMVEHEKERPKLIEMLWEQHHLWMTELINRTVREGYSADQLGDRMTPEEKAANRKFMFFMTDLVNPHLRQNRSDGS